MRIAKTLITLAATLAACETQTATSPRGPSTRLSASTSSSGSDLPIYGLGGFRRATPQSPCRTGAFRQFDFWVGEWRVFNIRGVFVATSRILVDLDGCVIEENWAPLNGLRGRSLSSFDAESGVWRQTWVPENSSSGNRPLRLAGGLQADGVMEMDGVRRFLGTGTAFIDTIRWTPVDANHVIQSTSLDIPAASIHITGAPHYERATSPLPPTTSPGTTNCFTGDAAESRNLDFTVGTWSLSAANGQSLGTSRIVIDPTLSGCLIEEKFSTAKGYEAIGWLYYDAIEDAYYRTYVDSEGERVELRGTFESGVLTLSGTEPIRGADGAQVRVTWSRTSANTLRQLWETSRDGGSTWRQAQDITFTRQ